MASSFSFGKVELVASLDEAEAPAVPDPETPFRILLMGDFRGRVSRDVGGLAGRRLVAIDRDNFDEVLDRLQPELHLRLAGQAGDPVVLRFRELDDFHPDRIAAHADIFRALRERRRAPGRATQTPATKPSPPGPGGDVSELVPGNLLEQVLAAARPEAARPREEDPWGEFLERIIAPHRVAPEDPRQADQKAGLDAAQGRLMREILHHPDFQALESNWRGLHVLTSRLETDARLTLTLLDVTRAELAEDLGAADPRTSALHKLLVGTEGHPWAVIVGALTLEPTADDTDLLAHLAALARRAEAPFLAAASPRFVGCDSIAATPDPDDWSLAPDSQGAREALRRHPDAAYLGLALPRFLLRLPYGRDGEPIEAFAFEELPEDPDHEAYLWGNPAFALAESLGRGFREDGWHLRPGRVGEIEGLPTYVERRGGEPLVKPCAEANLGQRAAEVLIDAGLMPLLSLRDQDVIRIGRF
ncbi:MAG TPA: type VI secretion system contractile sheath large subunit, partial [Isosphaeraceae bacterium]